MCPLNVLRDGDTALDPKLVADGYARRTTAAEPRLSELVEEYRRLGFEVAVVVHRVAAGACGECFQPPDGGPPDRAYGDVYVRRERTGARRVALAPRR